jgi:transcriptional regulator with XRE-family HTH domain
MTPMRHIRKQVLGLTQAEMAALTGARQATVSRWERGELEPDRDQMIRIRNEAVRRKLAWNDSWFFGAPTNAADANKRHHCATPSKRSAA